ncbi:PREDICTED: putative IQ motif and ankyrin repeat domain-containing protein, partial [Priapulus caudatus]|uniref:IQ motif and ankyrin repeat domain-containing protein n=1 Tax=Priapulus caudatus TaxID=37621 RepID=A0ABM1DUK3_PRICU
MKQRKEKLARNKRILEAAFEGEIDEIMAVFNEVKELDNVNGVAKDAIGRATRNRHFLAVVNAEDPNGNTPLSEAAAGGQSATVRLLIDKGANLNAQGAFARTPLYRAAFSGHLDVCEVLLLHGSDPRMYASDGSTPEQVASTELLEQFFRSWDISVTEKLLDNASAVAERRQKEEKDIRETEKTQLEELLAEVQSKYDARHRELNTAYCEWNKRILEHDNCVAAGSDKTHITLQAIQLAEQNLEVVKLAAKDTEVMLIDTKAKLRDFREYNQACAAENDDLPGIKVNIRELDDVLLKDIGNKIGESGKLESLLAEVQSKYDARHRELNTAYCEWNKRILEHDNCVAAGSDKTHITLQ